MRSVSEATGREWRLFVGDMIACAQKVLAYTEGLSQSDFIASGLQYDATLRNLELMGEAATRIPDAVKAANPDIPWRRIVATRNRLTHGYPGIDNDTLWSIIRSDVPSLLPLLRNVKSP
jgi:uncharacterized protein with HEPN domain